MSCRISAYSGPSGSPFKRYLCVFNDVYHECEGGIEKSVPRYHRLPSDDKR